MPTLTLLDSPTDPSSHTGEMLCCAYSPDCASILTGGWDGHLRLWDAITGEGRGAFRVNEKPVSACAVMPDGLSWMSGGLDGLLATWDAATQQREAVFLAHSRPISAIIFSPDGKNLTTASWDCNLIYWPNCRDRDGRNFTGHKDIVAGCRFTPSGRSLLSWSYDCTVRLWEISRTREIIAFGGHLARVSAGAVSPDGRWAASGSIDGAVKLWDLQADLEANGITLGSELRGCFFLLDAESLLTVSVNGQLTVLDVPSFEVRGQLDTYLSVNCAELSPSSGQLALGTNDGRLHLVNIDGLDESPLLAVVTKTSKRTQTALGRLVGKSTVTYSYQGFCPICRQPLELPALDTNYVVGPCPGCRRRLRFAEVSARV